MNTSTLEDGQEEHIDDMLDWDLPDDGKVALLSTLRSLNSTQLNSFLSLCFISDISVPNHLLPPFQDEDDECK